jgi:hypothetical protein
MSLPEVLLWRLLRLRPSGFKFRRRQAALDELDEAHIVPPEPRGDAFGQSRRAGGAGAAGSICQE